MTFTHVGDYQDANNTTSYGGAFMTPFSVAAGRLCLVSISHYSSLANLNLPSAVTASGTGSLTLRKVTALVATVGNEPSISIYAGVPTADFTGTITVTFAAQQRGIAIAVDTIDASAAEPVRLANIPTPTKGTGTGVTSTLAALSAATSLHFYAVSHQANEATTVAGGFTELSDLPFADAGNSTAHTLSTGWKLNDTTADPSWATSSAYVIASLEIQDAVITAPTYQDVYRPVWLADLVAA